MKLFIVAFVALSIIGCRERITDKKLITFDISEPDRTTEIKLSDLGFTEIIYVPLETSIDCSIKEIAKIEPGSDYFIVQYFNDVKKFEKNGTFLYSIGTMGRGPGEYLYAHDIVIDKKDDYVFIADGWSRKVNIYNENGKYIKSFKSPLNSTSFILIDNQLLFYCTNYISNIDTSFWFLDTNGVVRKGYKNKYIWNYNVQNGTAIFKENLFYYYRGSHFKKEIYSDTVYLIDKGKFVPDYIIYAGNKLLTTASRSILKPDRLFEQFYSQEKLFECRDFIYYEFGIYESLKFHRYSLIGSRTKNQQYIINAEAGIENDLDGGPSIRPVTVRDDNELIAWISAIDLKNYINSEEYLKSDPEYPEKKKELRQLVINLNETDNPVLILVK